MNGKKNTLLRLCLAAAMVLSLVPFQAFADQSTTTIKTAYKDLSANTEIYTVTQTPGSDYPYYGAKNEPRKGVYYGRTAAGGSLPSGGYGLINLDQMSSESVVGFYYDITQPYSLEYWSYLYGPAIQDGSRAFLVYLNFMKEGNDCSAFANGTYDAQLKEAFSYLNTLSNPVFVRIGGEVNVWTAEATPDAYIAAFRHVASLLHSTAPRAAAVFSPNYSSAYLVDMDSFYPGDAYVDWVGVSLYYNQYHSITDPSMAGFLGVGQYGDAMLNVQQTVNLSRMHKKPLMVTEGGSSNSYQGQDISSLAAGRMQKAYAFLPMVYPEIKAIVSSDYYHSGPNSYRFYDNAVVTGAYRRAVSNNPTYLSRVGGDASCYTKLSAYTGSYTGKMSFAAYTYSPDKLTAAWSVDGQTRSTVSDYPYAFELDFSTLSAGTHTLTVTFSNGASKSYSVGNPAPTAMPTNDALTANGAAQNPTVYKIGGSNYFKIRDLAAILSGTEKQFSVDYDNTLKSVTTATGKSYTKLNSDLLGAPSGGNKAANPSNDTIYVDGVKIEAEVYKIDGSNYFKLRDLGKAFNFYVGWTKERGMYIETDKPYSE